jgi:hypothetical protein
MNQTCHVRVTKFVKVPACMIRDDVLCAIPPVPGTARQQDGLVKRRERQLLLDLMPRARLLVGEKHVV